MFQIIFPDAKFRVHVLFMFLTGQYSSGCSNTMEALSFCTKCHKDGCREANTESI